MYLAKKAFIAIMILIATLLDRAMGTDTMVFQMACTCYYIVDEGPNVHENTALVEFPVPGAVQSALEQMREKHDDTMK